MNIAVTAATGQLGQLVVQALLGRGIPTADLIAVVRNPEKAAPLAARGVEVREADYSEPERLAKALRGVDRLLFISGMPPERLEQHRNVVTAAQRAGVGLIAYTSVVHAEESSLLLAADHKATEGFIRESGLPFALLRNSWYFENYTGVLEGALQSGVIVGSAGEGRVSAATRADYAEAAAAVLSGEGHENKVYELGGKKTFSLTELAAEISGQRGKAVVYRDLPKEEHIQTLVEAGVPEAYAVLQADSDRGIAVGDLQTDSGDLERLLGRPTTPLAQWAATTLAGLEQRA